MNNKTKAIIFSHGLESGPTGNKINYLSNIGKQAGFITLSIDYRGINDPSQRVQKLLNEQWSQYSTLILVGSSMGGYVSTVASEQIRPQGLFLLAPALNIPHYPIPQPFPHSEKKAIIHGWDDDVIPITNITTYAQSYKIPLHILHSNHRLESVLPEIGEIFKYFLSQFK